MIDLDATSGLFEFVGQSVPYAKTRYYGNYFDPSSSAASQAQATIRLYEPSRHLAFGVGYGVLQSWTYGTEPATTLRLEATGLRMEVHDRIATSANSRLELTVGGMPEMRGTIGYGVGIPGAPVPVSRLEGGQFDAEVREKLAAGKRFGFDYGVRYVDDRLLFAGSNAVAQRADALLPFVELRVRL